MIIEKQEKTKMNWERFDGRKGMERKLQQLESDFTKRFPNETVRGIMNFERAMVPDTPIDEIENALVSWKRKTFKLKLLI